MRVSEAMEQLRRMDPREPVFLLRAQDELAVKTVLHWCDQARELGVSPVKLSGALNAVAAMLHWPIQKKPD